MKVRKVGYTTGIFDLFHIGHLNVLGNAKAHCDYLIAGVTTDELAFDLKGRRPIIPFEERAEIVRHIRIVDKVVAETDIDKLSAWEVLRFDIIFKGDDWKGSRKWVELEREFSKRGVEVVYFPYTTSTSSSAIRRIIESY